jgi:hypothetical protein
LSIDICHLEEVEVWNKNPFRGRGALELSNQRYSHPRTLSDGERGKRCKKTPWCRSSLRGAA